MGSKTLFVVAVEGLPGAGKTTMIERLASTFATTVIEEVVVDRASGPTDPHDFYMANDLIKGRRMRSLTGIVLLDRYWISTAAYMAAAGHERATSAAEHLAEDCPAPDLWAYVDEPSAICHAFSSEGRWPERAFRIEHRRASLALLGRQRRVLCGAGCSMERELTTHLDAWTLQHRHLT
jgi:thymidylate kinase